MMKNLDRPSPQQPSNQEEGGNVDKIPESLLSESQVAIYDRAHLERQSSLPTFQDESREYRNRVESVLESGHLRHLSVLHLDVLARLKELKQQAPHFAEVINLVQDYVGRSLLDRRRLFRLPPIAIGGPPGIGKTWIVTKLAQLLGIPTRIIACAGQATGMRLTGLDRGYSGSYPGEIAQYLCELPGRSANPIFILDEFEKAGGNSSNGEDFHGAFYSLLESTTASCFQDRYYGFNVDASYINWICTVNDFYLLPDPIRSRLHYVEIGQPSASQMPVLVQNVYRNILQDQRYDMLVRVSPELKPEVVHQLLSASDLREVRQLLERGLCRASREYWEQGRDPVTEPLMLEAEHVACRESKRSAVHFGFIPMSSSTNSPSEEFNF